MTVSKHAMHVVTVSSAGGASGASTGTCTPLWSTPDLRVTTHESFLTEEPF